jgi:F-type H+-transporting ATPase subunit delta
MDRNRVTVRYAKALFELALEQDLLAQTESDISLVYETLKHPGFNGYISMPKISNTEKYNKVSAVLNPYLQPLTQKFIHMVFLNHRENHLSDICRNFVQMSKRQRNIVSAQISLADVLDNQLFDGIIKAFEQYLNSTIEVETKIDPELIGGFVFTINGWQYDASISASLNSIRKQLQTQ